MKQSFLLPQTFHPLIRNWFTETYGNPTSIQAESWPLIENGENVLALAPTGSGKTLTAFLSAISRFCPCAQRQCQASPYDAEKLTVLYVSPLKALNEDIKRNLLEPLAAIKSRFEKEGLPFPPICVQTRSGDTPQSERRRFYIRPPSILALTPESLAILLLNPRGRQTLSSVKYLIIDEIHAVLGNKRGAFLSCQIDRLALAAGEFQRISLSATVRNPQTAAEFTGGIGRKKVHIVTVPSEKRIDLHVEFPDMGNDGSHISEGEIDEIAVADKDGSRYTPLIEYILKRIWEGATLLVFTESRRRAERLCYFLNQQAVVVFARSGAPTGRELAGAVAFPHHGSLAKELRQSVEKGLAEGKLPCVVATASLELGIDIGGIDEVVLAGSTGNVSQALQRIGRSGHGVGQTSKGKLFAFHGMDLLAAAALKDAVDERDIEEIHPIENPLDVLAQLILALCSEKERKIDELYELVGKFYVFKNINYDSFYRVVLMLAGLVSERKLGEKSRLREIKPRLWFDKTEDTVGALDGTTTLLYSSGGVIASRGLYSLRLADGTKIGELDEEFVWERSIGDCFDFGARGWRIMNISSESVEVSPLEKRADFIPFWKGDVVFRSPVLTKRILAILDQYNKNADINTRLTDAAYNSLKNFLDSQSMAQNGLPLSGNKNIAVEIIRNNELNRDFCSIVFHSFRGGKVNYPFSLALSLELEKAINLRVESFPNDDSILFLLPRIGMDETDSPEEIFRRALKAMETQDTGGITRGERLFRNRLEISGVFGANFREAAERSLLLPKAPFGKRTPLWIMRQRSKRLFDAVADEDGFPVTAEAWRSCLVDIFDMDGFRELLSSINDGSVTLSFFNSNNPSPFSRNVVRQETGAFMYEYDERKDLTGFSRGATLSDKVIEEAIGNANMRPVLKRETVDNFVSRLRRELPGWAPEDALSLNEWVKERIAIPVDEWQILCAFMPETVTENIDGNKIKTITRNDACLASVVHREWEEDWKSEPLCLLGQWLRYEGPVSTERICAVFGVSADEAQDAAAALSEVDEVVCGVRVTTPENPEQPPVQESSPDSSLFICDRENLEMLLRISRKKQRPVIKERPSSVLIPFLALRQGLTGNDSSVFPSNLYAWTAPAKLWETEILTARNTTYAPEKINHEIHEGRLVWYGAGRERIAFCRPEDLDLVCGQHRNEPASKFSQLLASPFLNRPRDFWEIKNELAADSRSCAEALWHEVWLGTLTADSLDPVRRGIEHGYIPKEIDVTQITETVRPFGRRPRIPGALKNRWRNGAPVHGNWYSLVLEEQNGPDPLEEDTLNRDRVRLLLNRWGVLCRPLLEHEASPFSWSKLLPAIRRMELSGELIAGRFFSGLNSLQFASPSIIAELEQAESFGEIYWMNASDPASPAGLEIEGLEYSLCARKTNNRLYYRGANLIAVSCKNGRELQIFAEASDPDMAQLIALIKIPRSRNILPENKIAVEYINSRTAAQSDYAACFKDCGFVSDRGKLVCW
ncbi:MAG: DEAD/DEAH box helicase [Treponema sp.]|jgi:ATP-dependent Lhr-like helicase|nr:DEAD/DEAH box helicase [Treponema sp.]